MTIASTYVPPQYIGNGVTLSFPFSFPFFDPSELLVNLFDTATLADVPVQPVLNGVGTYDYIVSGTKDPGTGEYLSGAAVIFNHTPLGNHKITILRQVQATQNVVLTDNAQFPAKTVEGTLDRRALVEQQLADRLNRTLRVPDNEVALNSVPSVMNRAGRIALYDALGQPGVTSSTIADLLATPLTVANAVVNSVAELKTLTVLGANNGSMIYARGYYTSGDGGHGLYRLTTANPGADDGGAFIWSTAVAGCYYVAQFDGNRINVRRYGAKGDNAANDQPAVQAAVNRLLAIGSGTLYAPTGTYLFTTASVTLLQAKGVNIEGDGPDNTRFWSTGNFPAIQTNGCWRCNFRDFFVGTTGSGTFGAFELDGNYDGVHTMGVQGNKFSNLLCYANLTAAYAFAQGRRGSSASQGDNQAWFGVHFDASLIAGLFVSGGNAVSNACYSCDFQANYKYGLDVEGGIVNVYTCSFESTWGYTQIVQDGYDIYYTGAASLDTMLIYGCHSESMRFLFATGTVDVRGFCHTQGGAGDWVTGAKALNAVIRGITAAGNTKLYRCSTAGNSGGGQPVWPETGTVADGTAVWTETDFFVIANAAGEVSHSKVQLGQVSGQAKYRQTSFTRTDAPDPAGFISGSTFGFDNSWAYVGNSSTKAALVLGNNTAVWARRGSTMDLNLGAGHVLLTEGVGGGSYGDVGFKRGAGSFAVRSANALQVIGGFQLEPVLFADLGAAPNGTEFFVTDGLSGSHPLAGAGTGCKAIRQNGAWQSVS